jgi:hypothetical protein
LGRGRELSAWLTARSVEARAQVAPDGQDGVSIRDACIKPMAAPESMHAEPRRAHRQTSRPVPRLGQVSRRLGRCAKPRRGADGLPDPRVRHRAGMPRSSHRSSMAGIPSKPTGPRTAPSLRSRSGSTSSSIRSSRTSARTRLWTTTTMRRRAQSRIIGNRRIRDRGEAPTVGGGAVVADERLGGLLRSYCRSA